MIQSSCWTCPAGASCAVFRIHRVSQSAFRFVCRERRLWSILRNVSNLPRHPVKQLLTAGGQSRPPLQRRGVDSRKRRKFWRSSSTRKGYCRIYKALSSRNGCMCCAVGTYRGAGMTCAASRGQDVSARAKPPPSGWMAGAVSCVDGCGRLTWSDSGAA